MMREIFWVLLVVLLLVLAMGLRSVKPGTRMGVFRFGRFNRVSGPGLIFVAPFLESGTRVDLKQAIPNYHEGLSEELVRGGVKAYLLALPAVPTRGAAIAAASRPESGAFADWLVAQACAQTHADLRKDPVALERILTVAARAEAALRQADRFEVELPFITADAAGPRHFRLTVAKSDFLRFR
jgi:hypothetical protein